MLYEILQRNIFLSRYPDASEDTPYRIYSKKDAQEYLASARRIIAWVDAQLKK